MTGCHQCIGTLVLRAVPVHIGDVVDVANPTAGATGTWQHSSYADARSCRYADPYGNS